MLGRHKVLVFLSLALLFPHAGQTHTLRVLQWWSEAGLEVQLSYSALEKARGLTLHLEDPAGRSLASRTSDAQGRASFQAPSAAAELLVIEDSNVAGEGPHVMRFAIEPQTTASTTAVLARLEALEQRNLLLSIWSGLVSILAALGFWGWWRHARTDH